MPFHTKKQLQEQLRAAHEWAALNNPDLLTASVNPTDIGTLAAAAILKNEATGKIAKEPKVKEVKEVSLESIPNPELRAIVKESLKLTKEIFTGIGLTAPTPGHFVASNPNFIQDLTDEWEKDKGRALIFTPNISGLKWEEVLGDQYYLGGWQRKNAEELKNQSEEYLYTRGSTIVETINRDNTNNPNTTNTTLWTASFILDGNELQDLDKPYNDINGETCTISEYNTLQMYRLKQGKGPVDEGYYAWQHGKIPKLDGDGNVVGGLSPLGDYHVDRVRGSCSDLSSSNLVPSCGRRLPGVV
jgi:hypothetical protein